VEDEDERPIANTIRAYLEQEGYTVQLAHDGPGGLAAARRFLPDLVVLDIMLPGMDGLELLRQLRQDAIHPQLRQVRHGLTSVRSQHAT